MYISRRINKQIVIDFNNAFCNKKNKLLIHTTLMKLTDIRWMRKARPQKDTYHMVSFMWSWRIDRANLWWQTSEWRLALRAGGLINKGCGTAYWVIKLFYIHVSNCIPMKLCIFCMLITPQCKKDWTLPTWSFILVWKKEPHQTIT